MSVPNIENCPIGGFLTYIDDEGQQCAVGYLLVVGSRVFGAQFGAIDVSRDEANRHNKCLDQALLEGLDTNCDIGEGTVFYVGKDWQVRTFIGTSVIEGECVRHGLELEFERKGRRFRGKINSDADAVHFSRIS